MSYIFVDKVKIEHIFFLWGEGEIGAKRDQKGQKIICSVNI